MKKCKKCSNELNDNTKFCGKCGNNLEEIIESNLEKTDEKIDNKFLEAVKNHLEILAYKVDFIKGETETIILTATHPNKANILCSVIKDSPFASFATTWTGLKDVTTVEQYKLLNKLTAGSNIAQVVLTDSQDLRLYAMYIGDYNKTTFGIFIETFLEDNTRVLTNEKFKELFVK